MSRFWSAIYRIIYVLIYKILKVRLENKSYIELVQFVKFGIVGIINNLIFYAIFLFLMWRGMHYILSNIIGFSVSVGNAYFWNNKYVFSTNEKRVWWKTFLKTYISYAGTGIILSNILLVVWIEILGISVSVAPLINLFITVPLNFIINKFWAYKK